MSNLKFRKPLWLKLLCSQGIFGPGILTAHNRLIPTRPLKRSWIFFEKNWSHCRVCCQRYDSFTAISPVVFMGWFNYILVLQSAGGWLIYFQSIDQWLLRKFDPAPVTGYRLQVFLYVPVERCRILAHIILPLSFSVEQHLAKTPLPTCLVFVWLKHQLLMSETVRFWKKRVSLCPDLD